MPPLVVFPVTGSGGTLAGRTEGYIRKDDFRPSADGVIIMTYATGPLIGPGELNSGVRKRFH